MFCVMSRPHGSPTYALSCVIAPSVYYIVMTACYLPGGAVWEALSKEALGA